MLLQQIEQDYKSEIKDYGNHYDKMKDSKIYTKNLIIIKSYLSL